MADADQLSHLERFHDKLPDVDARALVVVYAVSHVRVISSE